MRRRFLMFFFAPIMALLLVGLLLQSVRSAQPPANLDPTAILVTAVVLPTANAPAAQPTTAATPATKPLPTDDADLIAVLDGEKLLLSHFRLAQKIDRTMAALLNTQLAAPEQLVEQMINQALVLQQMAASAELAADDPADLDALLTAARKTPAEFGALLAAAGIDRTEFERYFADLLAVETFARSAAAEQGVAVDAYIAGLQAKAHISYGPAAAAIRSPDPAPVTAAEVITTPETEARGLAVGQLAPDFTLPALGQEQSQTTLADLSGAPVVLSFWTTWCPYCLRQTPILAAEAERQGAAVRFVGVDVAEDSAAVAAYVAQHAIPYSILLDAEGLTAAAYAVDGYPTTYFLDATGHIIAHHIGSLSPEQLTEYINRLLTPAP